jgi:diguanylate cyclase (GGDEF)-like protein/PAS domain S-box-containing protein
MFKSSIVAGRKADFNRMVGRYLLVSVALLGACWAWLFLWLDWPQQAQDGQIRLGLNLVVLLLLAGIVLMSVRQLHTGWQFRQQSVFLNGITDHLGAGVVAVDGRGAVAFANPEAQRLLGYSAAQFENLRFLDLLLITPNEEGGGDGAAAQAAAQWQNYSGEAWLKTRDAKSVPVDMTISPLHLLQSDYQSVAVFIDIRDRIEAKQQLRALAYYDTLTGLANRTLFFDRVKVAIRRARRADKGLVVMVADLDNFKQINDSYGHASGDELLEKVAQVLRERIREADTVCRLGGDEFAILLESVDSVQAVAHVAKGIVGALRKPFTLIDGEVHTSASIGIAFFPRDGESGEELLKNADVAMYRAKETGRGFAQFFTPDMARAVVDKLNVEQRLRAGIESHLGLSVCFQPKVDMSSGQVLGFEALARWSDTGPTLYPSQFIPIAEKAGLIGEIGQRVLNEACRCCVAWQSRFPQAGVAVNLSAAQFRDAKLPQTIVKALTASGLPAQLLELELTESILLGHFDQVNETLIKLRQLGCTLAIDDFGTGYSSLAYLQRFSVNVLKIDKSFIDGLDTEVSQMTGNTLVAAILAMARALDLAVVAEGVEEAGQLDMLRRLAPGVNISVQGYLFSRPVTMEEVLHALPLRFDAQSRPVDIEL